MAGEDALSAGKEEKFSYARRISQILKKRAPSFFVSAVRGVTGGIEQRLYRPSHLKVLLRDLDAKTVTPDASQPSRSTYKRALVDWLIQAQNATSGGGVAGYYTLAEGWSAAYPETTGYLITTMLEASARLKDAGLATRAYCMADWEVEIQLSTGAWQGGFITAPKVPSVFNTGQVIDGLVTAYEWSKQSRYIEAAARAGQWLIEQQDADGAWRRYVYNNFPNTYSTRVAWPLLMLAEATGNREFQRAAVRYLEWASRCQDETGWFEQCTLEVNEAPLTHTLGYTIEGFIEAGILLQEERWLAVGKRAADALLHRFEVRRHLAGTYGKGWRGDHAFACVTGCAQLSRVWGRLYEVTQDTRYLNALLKINDFVVSCIDLRSANPGIRGGVKGSQPIWGYYMTYRYPNWAAKFTLDALFQEDDALTIFGGRTGEHHHSVRLPQ